MRVALVVLTVAPLAGVLGLTLACHRDPPLPTPLTALSWHSDRDAARQANQAPVTTCPLLLQDGAGVQYQLRRSEERRIEPTEPWNSTGYYGAVGGSGADASEQLLRVDCQTLRATGRLPAGA